MNIVVNGENRTVKSPVTLLELIDELGVADKVMAAAVNMQIAKKDSWDICVLNEGDKVELLNFVGGG